MTVDTAIVRFTSRKSFDSVGMICACGRAIAGFEGTIITCKNCGTQVIISVMVIRK